jgi:hypothetical protein
MTALNVYAAAAVAVVAVELWRRPRLRPLLPLGLALLVYSAAVERPWAGLGRTPNPEDLGPLVRIVERDRTPGDRVLLYARSTYVYAYYQTAKPVLVPASTTVGYQPHFDDPRLALVDRGTVDAALARALAEGSRVWLLGSRFHAGDEPHFRDAARARGHIALELRRPRALLVLVTP